MIRMQSALMSILQTSQIVLILTPLFKVVHEQQTIDQMVLRAIDKYKDHPSIVVIKQRIVLSLDSLM